MKDKLITEIQMSMITLLSVAQLDELRRVLTHSFRNIEITERKPFEPPEKLGNEELLDVFIQNLTEYNTQ